MKRAQIWIKQINLKAVLSDSEFQHLFHVRTTLADLSCETAQSTQSPPLCHRPRRPIHRVGRPDPSPIADGRRATRVNTRQVCQPAGPSSCHGGRAATELPLRCFVRAELERPARCERSFRPPRRPDRLSAVRADVEQRTGDTRTPSHPRRLIVDSCFSTDSCGHANQPLGRSIYELDSASVYGQSPGFMPSLPDAC